MLMQKKLGNRYQHTNSIVFKLCSLDNQAQLCRVKKDILAMRDVLLQESSLRRIKRGHKTEKDEKSSTLAHASEFY